ncbi:uncharacterized protein NECHADRAFT_88539 [Fusarium vanettenii 77-13-4]|uniref:LysM domain-containing protein n=1 Tax=Fusarium vanettenii (strain ATCC MYA-4622 / CBS 123669 / FGSC 9596 / NRRL 45880 / 77-13-4) TaxID=660122 RepID=C7ZQX6_FUSV7|nr:uncharacterized protein NECHADRAFT_88539 [Fusarium vanettenii 77-13-4]EEU33585.1 hypothetical protein NECHADRAFT_88539 [Fusarium vanettenii 77-13-4]
MCQHRQSHPLEGPQPRLYQVVEHIHACGSCSAFARKYGILAADIVLRNSLNTGCTSVLSGTYAYINLIGFEPPTTARAAATTTTGDESYIIGEKMTCQGVTDYNKAAQADFFKWNPEVDNAGIIPRLGVYAYTSMIGLTPKPTATAQPPKTNLGNGMSIPHSIQPGMAFN